MERIEEELSSIKERLTKLFFLSNKAVGKAVDSLLNGDVDAAREVVEGDEEVDGLHRGIETSCFSLLLLDSPYANDFLFCSGALKMITDLERSGDYASDIAEEALYLSKGKKVEHPDLTLLSSYVKSLLELGLRAFLNSDLELARSLDKEDEKIDELFLKVRQDVADGVSKGELEADEGIVSALVAKYLERIADHGVNLGEWVDYMLTGAHMES